MVAAMFPEGLEQRRETEAGVEVATEKRVI